MYKFNLQPKLLTAEQKEIFSLPENKRIKKLISQYIFFNI